MSSTTFSSGTVISSTWLNEVDDDIFGVEGYGAIGDGVTDDTAAITLAFASTNEIRFRAGKTYLVTGNLAPASNTFIYGYGATIKLKDSSNAHIFRLADGTTNVTIRGLILNGNKSNQTSTVHGITSTGTAVSNLFFYDLKIFDCKGDGIGLASTTSTGVMVSGCYAYNNDGAGLSNRTGTLVEATFTGNIARDNGTHNIGTTGIGQYITISGNITEASGTADNITGYNASNSYWTVTGNVARAGSNNGIHVGGDNLTVTGNTVHGPAQYGIVIRIDGVSVGVASTVAGNIVNSPGAQAGIWIDAMADATVTGNTVLNSTTHGILLNAVPRGVVSGNSVRDSTGSGIRLEDCDQVTVTGNTSTSNTVDGIRLSNTDDSTIIGNTCVGNTEYGIRSTGTDLNNLISYNKLLNNTTADLLKTIASTVTEGNLTGGTVSVTAAATTTGPDYSNYWVISGATVITNITASWRGRTIIIRASGAITINDGGNLVMAGNFVFGDGDTLTLICDGTNWYESCRSNN